MFKATSAALMLLFSAATAAAQPGTISGGNPPTEIRRIDSRAQIDFNKNLYVDLATGKVIRIKSTCSGAAVSAANELSACYDSATGKLRLSANGGAYADVTLDTASQTLTNKTLTTPTIASFTNAQHSHSNAAGGGQITDAALSAAIGIAKGGTGLTALGTANQQLRVNGAGNALEYFTPSGGISGLTTGQHVRAASATTVETDGVKRYTATLTQSGTSAPVATVLENSLGGTLVWARISAGLYTATLSGAFPDAAKVIIIVPRTMIDIDLSLTVNYYCEVTSANTVTLKTGGFESPFDNRLTNYPIEIRIYP